MGRPVCGLSSTTTTRAEPAPWDFAVAPTARRERGAESARLELHHDGVFVVKVLPGVTTGAARVPDDDAVVVEHLLRTIHRPREGEARGGADGFHLLFLQLDQERASRGVAHAFLSVYETLTSVHDVADGFELAPTRVVPSAMMLLTMPGCRVTDSAVHRCR